MKELHSKNKVVFEDTGKAGSKTTADTRPYHRLQQLIYPEQGICTERDLYFRLNGPAGYSAVSGAMEFSRDGRAEFNTYFNLFNIGKWQRSCALLDIHLALLGTGKFEVAVFLALPDRSWERLANEVLVLNQKAPQRIDLSHYSEFGQKGILFFELKALGAAKLTDAAWETRQPPRRTPSLVVSITTFRREAAVQQTVRRFERYLADSTLRDHLHLVVVDNGKTAEIEPSANVSLIENENLGGAGGFSRGLLAAKARGASHCLFMDDDASIHIESVERTWVMLAWAVDPATAIAGAMINAAHRWAIWENGAVFNKGCIPLFMGTDLRDAHEVFAMEFDTTGEVPRNFYGGWWFFAFPVDQVKHMPFPFFVRGDDVSFSLVHDFNMMTLPGVVSFQDSFTDKATPQTWYLDLRSHLVHHLALPKMEIGAWRTIRIALWFFLRNLPRMHYETISAINLAVEDVMQGPDFFVENADMAQRRADIRAMTDVEAWHALDPERANDRNLWNPQNRFVRGLMKITLNGHFLPFFNLIGNRITLPAEERASVRRAWGASQITYLDATRRNAYTVRHSKLRFVREAWRFLRNAMQFSSNYQKLLEEWRLGYDRITTGPYWNEILKVEKPQINEEE